MENIVYAALLAFIALGLIIVSSCSRQAESAVIREMTCEGLMIGGSPGERCESDEAICIFRGDNFSCFKKG